MEGSKIFPFKNYMYTRKNFSEIYRQFGHAPSKIFASSGLDSTSIRQRLLPSKSFTVHPSLIIKLLDAMQSVLLTHWGNTQKQKE